MNSTTRYIPVPTGNSNPHSFTGEDVLVYPCTYRELDDDIYLTPLNAGISLYLQGTL